jgi:hypothetical protein
MKPAINYPKNIFNPITPDQEQSLAEFPIFQTIYKGSLTGCEIYERLLPDRVSSALKIDGPGDSSISLDQKGSIRILTGIRNKERGPGSGKLAIKSWGQQCQHNNRSDIQYNAGDDKEGQALNVLCYGDYVEQSIGSTRTIKASKIVIEAAEELILIGKNQVNIQAGSNGGGAIILNAGSVEKTTSNDKETILGQKLTFGVSEDTVVQFDPRASKNIVSSGSINHRIVGDYLQWTAGCEQHLAAGSILSVPLIKNRSSTFKAESLVGNTNIESASGFTNIAGTSGVNVTSAAVITQTAGTTISIAATGNVVITGALIFLN